MKKHGILHAQLSYVIANLGHGDMLVVCDSGFPIPYDKEKIDLALAAGIPSFEQVLKLLMAEVKVEKAIVAKETSERSPHMQNIMQDALAGIEMETISHERFKQIGWETTNITFVRSGEQTPFSNLILVAGVTF